MVSRSIHPEIFLSCSSTLLTSHFDMCVVLEICCIFSEHLFLSTPLDGCFLVSRRDSLLLMKHFSIIHMSNTRKINIFVTTQVTSFKKTILEVQTGQYWFNKLWSKRFDFTFSELWDKDFQVSPEIFEFIVSFVRHQISTQKTNFR